MPELQAEVLALVTDRLIKIDVQVQVDIEELGDEVGDDLVQQMPRIRNVLAEDVADSDDSASDSDESEETLDQDLQRTKDISRDVLKMDSIMNLLFAHYQKISIASVGNSSGSFDILLAQFVSLILPTQRSRHTQFLIFHFAQQSSDSHNVDIFVGTLAQAAFERRRPALVRQAAAAYLASFVARGMRVPPSIVHDVFDYISSELSRLRREYEPLCREPDLRRFSSYYCLVQALLYMFCFRWRDLEYRSNEDCDDDNDYGDDDLPGAYGHTRHWRKGVKETFSQNLFSCLNPLEKCSEAIVREFARIAKHLEVVYVDSLLESNRYKNHSQHTSSWRNGTRYEFNRETALDGSKDKSLERLDAYFPFDPYHLPQSKKWIDGEYRAWAGIPGLDDQEADNESDEEEETAVEGSAGEDTDSTRETP